MQKLIPTLLISFLAVQTIVAVEALPKKIIVGGQTQSTGGGDILNELPVPAWVWGKDQGKTQFVRTTFGTPANLESARLVATCDNVFTLWINGKQLAKSGEWGAPVNLNVLADLAKTGKNVIAIKTENPDGPAGLIAKLVLTSKGGAREIIMTGNDGWKVSETEAADWQTVGFDDSAWQQPEKIAALGAPPWGIPGGKAGGGSALTPDKLKIAGGFRAELLYTVPAGEQGSWVALTKDAAGRLIASDQGGKGLFRISVKDTADAIHVDVEKIPVAISGAQGLTWAHGKLYAHVTGAGLFAATDTNNDGMPDAKEELGGANGGGEHGNHAVIPDMEGENLWVVAGNHTALPQALVKGSSTTWSEDHLLPRDWDANGHAKGILAPGGWICKVTPDGKNYFVHSMGYRNQYDIGLNRFGDVFAYDADMEWDMGSPWYRPTRISHATSGSDFGWRSGTGKWPTYYEDSLPPVVDIGPGSPTGTVMGTGAKFPTKYQDALFALDWTFGTIYAIHLTPQGASYTAKTEEFVSGAPLPVTDAIVGNDGALYFTTGGRGTQSALYRVVYTGSESTAAPTGDGPPDAAQARALRRSLEAFHGKQNPKAVATAWPHLGSTDRFIRNAARVAIEAQPAAEWASKVFPEKNTQARITAAVALARSNDKQYKAPLIASLLELSPKSLEESQLLGLLRAYGLTFMRLGAPDAAEKAAVIAELNPLFPAKTPNLNTELAQILVYLDAPDVVSRTMELIRHPSKPIVPDWFELIARNGGYGGSIRKLLDNPTPAQEIGYAFILRNVRYGWTIKERREYVSFLNNAGKFSGGNSYAGFLTNIRSKALENASAAERAALADLTGETIAAKPDFAITPPKGPGRAWTVDSALAAIGENGAMQGRDFNSGRNLLHATACASCHRFDGLGGSIGPDLTTVRNKFSARDLLEAIIEPSKVISDQYGSSTVTLNNGKTHAGLVITEGDIVTVHTADPKAEPVVINHSDVKSIEVSPISQMPPGLINSLSADELRDLIAYLMSRGNSEDPMFKK
jgi:putative heme-binding domain-containing protein